MTKLDPGPIQPALVADMNKIARLLDDLFNGPNCLPEKKQVWFFLAAGKFDNAAYKTPDTSRFNYISNADKLDIRATLHDVLARIEARLFEGGRA